MRTRAPTAESSNGRDHSVIPDLVMVLMVLTVLTVLKKDN